jgi:hypothetical protein
MSKLDMSQAPRSSRLLSGPLEYNAGGLTKSLHGNIYQLKLLMLFLIRGLRNSYSFRLATEKVDAEKFDDVVFGYKDTNGRVVIQFLQAKHRQDKYKDEKISKNDLLNEHNGDFSLQKYFTSYRKITEHATFIGAEHDFMIFTNIDFNDQLYKDGWFEPIDGKHPILSTKKNKCKIDEDEIN